MSEQGENLTSSIPSTPVESTTPTPSSTIPNASPSQKKKAYIDSLKLI